MLYFESHTYNYLVNGQRALILPKLETQRIILGWREYVARLVVKKENKKDM